MRNSIKKYLAPILALLMIVLVPLVAIAANPTPVTFTTGGPRYIYSNTPEAITSATAGRYYTISQYLTANIYTHVFYYHGSYYSGSTMEVGVAVKNTGTTNATVVVRSKHVTPNFSGTRQYVSDDVVAYQNGVDTSADDIYYTLTPGQVVYLQTSSLSYNKFIQGQLHVTANTNNVNLRVFWRKSGDTINPFDSTYKRAPGEDPSLGRTTGYFQKDTRYATIDYNTKQAFWLNFVGDYWSSNDWRTYNPYEYEIPTNYIGSQYLAGNYGIKYDLVIKNASGKTLKITPRFLPAQIVIWTPDLGWHKLSELVSSTGTVVDQIPDGSANDKYWTIPITSSAMTIREVLPGANSGSIKYEIQ